MSVLVVDGIELVASEASQAEEEALAAELVGALAVELAGVLAVKAESRVHLWQSVNYLSL